jgi:hypothetical protein
MEDHDTWMEIHEMANPTHPFLGDFPLSFLNLADSEDIEQTM